MEGTDEKPKQKCSRCGAEISYGTVCSVCRAKDAGAGNKEDEGQKPKCSRCGAEIAEGTVCSECKSKEEENMPQQDKGN